MMLSVHCQRRRTRKLFASLWFVSFLGMLLIRSDPADAAQRAAADPVVADFNQGVALMDQFKFKEAASRFEAVLERAPDLTPAVVNLGIALYYDQQIPRAEQTLSRALSLDPNRAQAHYLLGLIYSSQGRVQEAIQKFEEVRKQDPDDAATAYYLGRMNIELRSYSEAVGFFREVVEQEPYNASAHYNLATALIRIDQREAGRRAMREFQRLQGLYGSTTLGLQYREQGAYAAAIDRLTESDLPNQVDPAPHIEVHFTDVTDQVGLDFKHQGPGTTSALVGPEEELAARLVGFVGSGIMSADFNGDGWLDLFLANAGSAQAASAVYLNRGDGIFRNASRESGIDFRGHTMHAVSGDFDNNGLLDLYLINYGENRLFGGVGDGRFQDVTQESGTGDTRWGLGGTFVDLDHDGDLDLFVANYVDPASTPGALARFPDDYRGSPNTIYRNNGNGTFTDVSEASGLAGGNHKTTAVVTTDLDDSRDIDLVVVNQDAPLQLFNNLRDGSFRLSFPFSSQGDTGSTGLAVGDWSGDGLVDLVLPALGNSGAVLENLGNNRLRALPGALTASHGSQLFDFDNDGDLDILLLSGLTFASSDSPPTASLKLLENQRGQFVEITEAVGLTPFQSQPVRGATIGDWDRDGDLDIALSVNGAKALLLRNEGGNQNHWLSVRLEGTSSNRPGIGAKVEIKAQRSWQRREIYGGHGFLSGSPTILHFGLGKEETVDAIRLLWPNGILQSELDVAADQTVELKELDRKGTSCPLLYVWDGSSYKFQTDFLGGSAYGYLLAPGVYNYPDTDEYIKLDTRQIALKDGHLAISLNNQLEEVILFDQLELVVVDHSTDYQIFPDEKLLPGPPYQDFRLLSVSRPQSPLRAVDGQGRDVLDSILRIDRTYPEGFQLLPFKGYAEEHELIVDLGNVSQERTILLMHAWIDYADSSSNLAASQAGERLIPPYLQVENEQGEWVTVLERMGFPAGLPKTMTVDLSGKFLSTSRRIRIVTNMRIYWDQILVESQPARTDYKLVRKRSSRAELSFKGYPEFSSPDGKRPKQYFYERSLPTAEWKTHVGAYTRFGEVAPLLEETDDMFVITRAGDQIEATFDLSDLPSLPQGWTRDYIVYVDGFGKDMDPNSAAPHFLGPLPSHAMSAFPYPEGESYPNTAAHQEYLRTWNTRFVEHALPELGSKFRTAVVPSSGFRVPGKSGKQADQHLHTAPNRGTRGSPGRTPPGN